MDPLPIGLVIPTRNCVESLRRHLAGIRPLASRVREIVAVDSQSTDGTLEVLQKNLGPLNAKVLSHPPGLYESWNFGIRHLSAPFAYISTVGDLPVAGGVERLLETAIRFQADVVLSPPAFEREGRALPDKEWTIHQYIRAARVGAAAPLPRSHLFLASVFAGPAGMMGSSASNLYRTKLLQETPFPADFGHIGDTAWGLAHAFEFAAAIEPERCAAFDLHPNAGQVSAEAEGELARRLLDLARAALHKALEARQVPPEAVELGPLIGQFASWQALARQAHTQYRACCRSPLPWFLQRRAWRSRRERDRLRRLIDRLRLEALRQYNF